MACKKLLVGKLDELIVAKGEVGEVWQAGCELRERIALEIVVLEPPASGHGGDCAWCEEWLIWWWR